MNDSNNNQCQNASAGDKIAEWLIYTLQQRHNPDGLINKVNRSLRVLLFITIILYALTILLIFSGIELIGQHFWLTAFLSYIPHFILLYPAIIIAPICLLFEKRLFWFLLAFVFSISILAMKFEVSIPEKHHGKTITVLTNNIGQDNRQSVSEFIKRKNPDIILLQEAFGRGRQFTNAFPQYFMAQRGEFVLLSKFPIKNYGYTKIDGYPNATVSAYFEVEINGKPVVIYNVHMPSPRSDLLKSFGKGFIIASIGTVINKGKFGAYKMELQKSWENRSNLYTALSKVFAYEQRPFIVAGDFNLPNYGPIYRQFCNSMSDAFAKSGFGYGYTCPANTMNPIVFFKPWMRIDYIFAGRNTRPINCQVESGRRSQHLAVLAELEIQ